MTRVLEHLERLSKEAAGDRLLQLDVVDAFTRLGDVQGNPYEQNIGDPEGALLQTLAVACRASGQMEKAREAAREGLALLPAVVPGSPAPRLRKLLEAQAGE